MKIKAHVAHQGGDTVILIRVHGPEWAVGVDPEEVRKRFARVVSEALMELYQRTVEDMAREFIEGSSTLKPRGVFHEAPTQMGDFGEPG